MEVIGTRLGKKKTKDSDTILPPCRVCGQKSQGFHYGVYTCEACKGFFRRVLKKSSVNFQCICLYSQRCESGDQVWTNNCANCRYKRCLYVGMSREGIKIGRYSLTKKNQNIIEAKKLKQQQQQQQTDIPSKGKIASEDGDQVAEFTDSSMSTSESSPEGLEDSPITQPSSAETESEVFDLHGISNSVDTVAAQSESRGSNFELSENEMDQIIELLVQAQEKMYVGDYLHMVSKEELERSQREYFEEYKLKTDIFGRMQLTNEQAVEIYLATGMDLVGRVQFVSEMLEFMEKKIVKLVAFVKEIPGFTRIPINDQANLVKASYSEVCYLGSYRTFNPELQVITTCWGKHLHRDQLTALCSLEMINLKFRLAKTLWALDLSPEEAVLFRTITITSKDKADISCPDDVDAMQWKLVTCLRYWIEKHKSSDKNRLARIFAIMPTLRELGAAEAKRMKNISVDMPMFANRSILQALY